MKHTLLVTAYLTFMIFTIGLPITHETHQYCHQYRFSENVWAGVVTIGPYLMPSPLTGPVYKIFLEDGLVVLLEDVSLDIRRTMRYQHDGAPAHYRVNARQLLTRCSQTGREAVINCPVT